MDLRRHVTAGRLSELFGEQTLETRQVHPHPRLETGRRAGAGPGGAGDSTRPAVLRRRGQRLPRPPVAERVGPCSTPCSGSRGSATRPEPWTPVDSLAWLKAMAWDLRGNMDDEIARVAGGGGPHPGPGRELFPPYPFAEHQPIVATRRGRRRGVGPSARPADGQPAAPGRRTRRAAVRQLRRPAAGARGDARAARPRRRPRLELLGGRRRSLRDRLADPGQRPAPRGQPAGRLDADGAALPPGRRRLSAGGRRLHVLRGARRDHRPQRRHRVGLHQPRTRRHRPLSRAGARRHLAARRGLEAAAGADRDDPGARRRRRRAAGADDATTGRCSPMCPRSSRRSGPTRLRSAAPATTPSRCAWTALTPSTTADAILAIDRASTWKEFRAAASDFAVPAQNLVYADRQGHIGYQAPGRSRSAVPGNDGLGARRGVAARQRLDRPGRAVRGAAARARPGGGVHRHRQPGGGRPRLPLPPHQRLGPAATAPSGSATCSSSGGDALGRRTWPRLQLDDLNPMARDAGALPARRRRPRVGVLPRRAGPAPRLGRPPAGADSAAAAYYNAVWRQPAAR